MQARRWAAFLGFALAIAGCHETEIEPPETVGESRQSLEITVAEQDGQIVLDRVGAMEITGSLVPVRPQTDAFRKIDLETFPEGLKLEEMTVLDARLTKNGAVTIAADRVLRHHTRDGIQELDREALGPISVEAGRVAYVKGGPPDLALKVATLETGEVERVAPGLATTWSPALSPDGREIAFAAVYESRPRLFIRDAAGELHLLNSSRTPSSPIAPTWRDGVLNFEDEHGNVRVDVHEREAVRSEVPQ